jgi:hypothetical protein
MTAGRSSITLKKDWCTPPALVRSVMQVLGDVHLDPCSNLWSTVPAKVKYQLPDTDGLVERWDYPTIYVNPPYGRDAQRGTTIYDWLSRVAKARTSGSQVMALVPVATNTKHWKDFVYPVAAAVCFLSATRLKFYTGGTEDPKGAPMSCAMIYYGDDLSGFRTEFRQHGAVMLPDTPERSFVRFR